MQQAVGGFITVTCNPNWPEIRRELKGDYNHQTAWERPDVVNMVFHRKLALVVKWLKAGKLNKTYIKNSDAKPVMHYWIHVIEFQRRGACLERHWRAQMLQFLTCLSCSPIQQGLPHAHIVFRMQPVPNAAQLFLRGLKDCTAIEPGLLRAMLLAKCHAPSGFTYISGTNRQRLISKKRECSFALS